MNNEFLGSLHSFRAFSYVSRLFSLNFLLYYFVELTYILPRKIVSKLMSIGMGLVRELRVTTARALRPYRSIWEFEANFLRLPIHPTPPHPSPCIIS